jgi:hypothetical protein
MRRRRQFLRFAEKLLEARCVLTYSGARRDSACNNKNWERTMLSSIARIFVASALLAPAGVFASPIKIDFTITATQSLSTSGEFTPGGSYAGFAGGTVGGGSITFDDAIGSSSDIVNGLPTLDLDFAWLGQSFTEANATLWGVTFDSTGALTSWGIGRRGVEEGCGLNCSSTVGPTDFSLLGLSPIFGSGDSGFMHVADFNGSMFGAVSWTAAPAPVTDVPEPATFGLLVIGLLGIAVTRRARCA